MGVLLYTSIIIIIASVNKSAERWIQMNLGRVRHVFNMALLQVKENFLEYVLLNVLYYGLVASFMIYSFAFPEAQRGLLGSVRAGLPATYPRLVEAYSSGNFPLAAALTFLVNLFLGSFVGITLISLVIPFGGILMGCVRAVLWGILLAPASPELAWVMIPHSLTLILEGQGYILAMFAAYLQWKGVIWPKSVGQEKRLRAYLTGMKKTAYIYILVTLVLAVSAIYEAFEVIYIVGTLQIIAYFAVLFMLSPVFEKAILNGQFKRACIANL